MNAEQQVQDFWWRARLWVDDSYEPPYYRIVIEAKDGGNQIIVSQHSESGAWLEALEFTNRHKQEMVEIGFELAFLENLPKECVTTQEQGEALGRTIDRLKKLLVEKRRGVR
jgi:hypothetical protein